MTGHTGVPSRVPPLLPRPDRARQLVRTTRARHSRRRGVEGLGLVVCRHTARANPRLYRACWAMAGDLHLRRLRRPVGARNGKCRNDRKGGGTGATGYINSHSHTHTVTRTTKRARAPVFCPCKDPPPFSVPSSLSSLIGKTWRTNTASRTTTSSTTSTQSKFHAEFFFY